MKKITTVLVLIAMLCMPLFAQVNMGGRFMFGFSYHPAPYDDTTVDQIIAKECWNFSKPIGDFASFYIERRSNDDTFDPGDWRGTHWYLQEYSVSMDVLGALMSAIGADVSLPVTLNLKAGHWEESGGKWCTHLSPSSADRAIEYQIGGWARDHFMDISLGILGYVNIGFLFNPDIGSAASDDLVHMNVNIWGGASIAGARLNYQLVYSTLQSNFGKMGFGVMFDTGSLIMGGDLGVRVSFNMGIDVDPDAEGNVWNFGTCVGMNFRKYVVFTAALTGGDEGFGDDPNRADVIDSAGLHHMEICLQSTPIDLLSAYIQTFMALYQDASSVFEKLDIGVKLNLPVAISMGIVATVEDAAGNEVNPFGDPYGVWAPFYKGQRGTLDGGGVGIYIQTEVWY